jgi:hypothetical protein
MIPYVGVQTDEALFTVPVYPHTDNNLHAAFPLHLMVIDYIGSLKTLLYWPILRFLSPTIWTLRVPVVLIGGLSIFVFFKLTSLSAGRTTAVLVALLLATDPVFLLTDTFDWGPVALEHLLLVTGCWYLFRFGSQPFSNRTIRNLSLGFFCFGLALWNKAVFVWVLTGLTAGGLLVFWPEIRERLTRRNLAVAAGAFLLGASPLVVYNLRHFKATLNGRSHLDTAGLPSKWIQLERALNGSSLFGFMVSDEPSPNPKTVASLPVWIREHVGDHRQTGFYYVCGALLLLAPWWWHSRAARFSLVFTATAWLTMVPIYNAGTGVHHVVQLWPFPILFAAAALASLPWRPVVILAGVGMVAMNLLVVNQYLAQLEQNGAAGSFTDAIFPLSEALPEKPGNAIYVLDWGISEPLTLLHQGRLNIPPADLSIAPSPSEIHRMLTGPQALFVSHVPGQEFFTHWCQAVEADALASGYHKEMLRTVADSKERPVFEVFRFVR